MPTNRSSSPTVSNVITVKIFEKKSGNPIPDLVVDLLDLENWHDPESRDSTVIVRSAALSVASGDIANVYKICDRIGSRATDARGECRFDVIPKDFNLPGKTEQKPDLLLVILAPEEPGWDLNKRVLYFSQDVRFNAGSEEADIIRLPAVLLEEKDIPYGPRKEANRETAHDKVTVYVSDRDREKDFNAGVADYHRTQTVRETQERKAFRKDFIKTVGTDLSAVVLSGAVAAEGDNIQEKNQETVSNGVERANEVLDVEEGGVPVNLYLTPSDLDDDDLKSYFEAATGEYVDIPEADIREILFRPNSTENPGTLLIHNNPIAAFCAAETADEKCAKAHAGVSHDDHSTPADRFRSRVEAALRRVPADQ
jgi:hypothetical protein